MHASKEFAIKAIEELRSLAEILEAREIKSFVASQLATIQEFIAAAHGKLPYEDSYEKEKKRRKNKR
jgi:hypothetical protein